MTIDGGKKARIKIVKNGPYLVSGSVPLSRKSIVPAGRLNKYQEVKSYPIMEEYALCRCGHSKTPPFCDGTHGKIAFDGSETASRAAYLERAQVLEGPDLALLDDDRCAYARFCHRKEGNVWDLTRASNDPNAREQAIIAANECPSGRLVPYDLEGNSLETQFEPAIEILEDIGEGVSGPLFVKGNIEIESSDGFIYEPRNRAALCRCGNSDHKPYCDASHVNSNFSEMN